MVQGHISDVEIFYRDQIIGIDDPATALVGEIIPPPRDPFMGTRYHLPAFLALYPGHMFFTIAADGLPDLRIGEIGMVGFDLVGDFRSFGFVSVQGQLMLALCLCQRFLLCPKEARILNSFRVRARGKRVQPYVNADLVMGGWQWRWLPLAGDGNKPLPSRCPANGRRFGRAFQRAMVHDLHIAHLGEQEALRAGTELDPVLPLGIGQAIIPPGSFEAGIAGVFARFKTAKEGIKRLAQPQDHILQDLGMDLLEGGALSGLEQGQFGLLIVVIDCLLALVPGGFSFGEQGIPEPAAFVQLRSERANLSFGRIQAVLECLEHQRSFC
jgi:hypothetical protein